MLPRLIQIPYTIVVRCKSKEGCPECMLFNTCNAPFSADKPAARVARGGLSVLTTAPPGGSRGLGGHLTHAIALVNRTPRNNPLCGLTRHLSNVVEVSVIVKDNQTPFLGGSGY